MTTSRDDLVDALSAHPTVTLREIARLVDLEPSVDESPRAVARLLANLLWWSYCTPLGYRRNRVTLDDMVEHLVSRLSLHERVPPDPSAWARLHLLTRTLSPSPSAPRPAPRFEDLEPKARQHLSGSWLPTAGWLGGASTSIGAGALGRGVVRLGKTPVGRVLPHLPGVGRAIRTIYRGGNVAAIVGGPTTLLLSLLAANQSMGTDYPTFVTLLLGIGALDPPAEAEIL